ncbi:thiol-activated cytolysin family protein [uncultured Bacteroides sp.]|uniref:thiol-activated cytolysin family protein n=1 Tax=uncultured Bacteroides sp. TaxID=162156 RepID=UPI002AAB3251|nr:thiol-activated cytolysin family protein [uncultured Bacteroides sp.]
MKKNINFKKPITLLSLALLLFVSCSKDENAINDNKQKETKGRFDNKSFVWDEVYAQRPVDDIYIGDLNVSLVKDDGSQTRSGRISTDGSSRSGRGEDSSTTPSDNLFIINPIGVYVGAAYPKSSFPYKFDKEITTERNPIDIVFDFRDPFIDQITRETGSIGYKLSLKSAINSNEYQKQVVGDKPSLEYYFTQYYSYTDLEKAFSGNASLGSIFSTKVSSSSKKINIQSRTLAKLVSINFSVYMDTPPASKGFFKDPATNKKDNFSDVDLPVYIRSLTYGKVVYVAIESEYSYSEVKQALEAAIKYKFVSANISMDQQVTKIFSKSSTTIFAISDNSSQSFFMDGLANLSSLFTVNYTSTGYGYPIYMQGRYVYDNSSYLPATSSRGGNESRGADNGNTGNTGGRRSNDTGSRNTGTGDRNTGSGDRTGGGRR